MQLGFIAYLEEGNILKPKKRELNSTGIRKFVHYLYAIYPCKKIYQTVIQVILLLLILIIIKN